MRKGVKEPVAIMAETANKIMAERFADKYKNTQMTYSEYEELISKEWKKIDPIELISPIEDEIIVEKMKSIYNEWVRNCC